MAPAVFAWTGGQFLFSDYPALVGYDVSFKLSASATYAFRVQRSSDSAEQDIGFTGDGLIDESALSSFVGAGTGYVTKLYNQGTGGTGGVYDASQATQANMPVVVSGGTLVKQNGKLAMDMGVGVLRYLTTGTFPTLAARPLSYVYVATCGGTLGTRSQIVADAIDGTDRMIALYSRIIGGLWSAFSGTAVDDGASDKNQNVVTTIFKASNQTNSWVNQVQKHTNAATGTNAGVNGLTIGVNYVLGLNASHDGTIQNVMLYESDENANRTAIETALNDHYGAYV